MTAPTTAKVYLEIEITLEGTFMRGQPERGPTYDCGGEPPEPSGFEDVRATGMAALVRDNNAPDKFRRIDLLANVVNPHDRDALFDNLLSAVGDDECQSALFAELPEEWD